MSAARRGIDLPRATENFDAAGLKAKMTEHDHMAVYRAIGYSQFKRAGDNFVKVVSGNNNPSLNINRLTGDWTDHRTGDYGDEISAVQTALGCTFPEALRFMQGIVGAPTNVREPVPITQNDHFEIVETYVYPDKSGEPYLAVDRGPQKQFIQKRADGCDGCRRLKP